MQRRGEASRVNVWRRFREGVNGHDMAWHGIQYSTIQYGLGWACVVKRGATLHRAHGVPEIGGKVAQEPEEYVQSGQGSASSLAGRGWVVRDDVATGWVWCGVAMGSAQAHACRASTLLNWHGSAGAAAGAA